MIHLIQGTPGSGKSFVALMLALDHVLRGGMIAMNFSLVKDWALQLALMNPFVQFGFYDAKEVAKKYYDRAFLCGDTSTLYDLSKLIDDTVSPVMRKKREGKALLILDEAQLYFNSRQWSDNFPWIEFFTQHRKLGWDIILIAHHKDMIDKQVRPLIELESKARNVKNLRIPFTPIPFWPLPLFFYVTYYSGFGPGSGMIHSRNVKALNKKKAALYDSMSVFAFDKLPTEYKHQGLDPLVKKKKVVKSSSSSFFNDRKKSNSINHY